MRLPSWPGYHRHDLRCTPDSRKVPQTTPGSLHDFYRPNLGLWLFSQVRSLEDFEEYWMSRQGCQHCEILPRWLDGMCPWYKRNLFTSYMARSKAVYSHCNCSAFSSPWCCGGLWGLRPRLCSSDLMAASSNCAVSRRGRVSFLSSFVISFMLTTVYSATYRVCVDRFSNAAHGFGLTVSLRKAGVTLQPNRFQVNPKLVSSQP